MADDLRYFILRSFNNVLDDLHSGSFNFEGVKFVEQLFEYFKANESADPSVFFDFTNDVIKNLCNNSEKKITEAADDTVKRSLKIRDWYQMHMYMMHNK